MQLEQDLKRREDTIRFHILDASELRNKLHEAERWKVAILDELVICGIYTKAHELNPRKSLHDVINWNCQVALDPLVSSDAAALVESGKESLRIVMTYKDSILPSLPENL